MNPQPPHCFREVHSLLNTVSEKVALKYLGTDEHSAILVLGVIILSECSRIFIMYMKTNKRCEQKIFLFIYQDKSIGLIQI